MEKNLVIIGINGSRRNQPPILILPYFVFGITVQMFKGSTSLQLPRQYGVKTRDAGRENG